MRFLCGRMKRWEWLADKTIQPFSGSNDFTFVLQEINFIFRIAVMELVSFGSNYIIIAFKKIPSISKMCILFFVEFSKDSFIKTTIVFSIVSISACFQRKLEIFNIIVGLNSPCQLNKFVENHGCFFSQPREPESSQVNKPDQNN